MEPQTNPELDAKNKPSPPLGVMCGICNDFFRANELIHSTALCGHIFHKTCLFRWLKISKTCPHCRSLCHRQMVHRIALNFTQPIEQTERKPAFEWVHTDTKWFEEFQPPEGAIQCGTDEYGNDTYVARAFYNNEMMPAIYVAIINQARATSYDQTTIFTTENVELLVLRNSDHKWVPGHKGSYPRDALQTGIVCTGDVTYTGRAKCEGLLRLGMVNPLFKAMIIPNEHETVVTDTYEVLVITPRS